MNHLLDSITESSILKIMNDEVVIERDFADMAIQNSTNMIQEITNIRQRKTSLTDRNHLAEAMADNILATLYLMKSLEMTNEVRMEIEKKHEANCRNAKDGCFFPDSVISFDCLLRELKYLIKKAGGKSPMILFPLDDRYCMVVEFHLSYNLVYVQKYDKEFSYDADEECYSTDALTGTSYYSMTFFDMEKDFEDALRKAYNGYKNSIYI